MYQDQKQRPTRKYPSRRWLFGLFIILISISVITAVHTQGEWATILSLILTALGFVLTAWQIANSSPSKEEYQMIRNNSKKPVVVLATENKEFISFQDHCKANLKSNNFGGLVIYGNEEIVGCIVVIFVQPADNIVPYKQPFRIQPLPTRTYENPFHSMKTAYIAQHPINSRFYLFAAVFSDLLPSTYHVELHSKFGPHLLDGIPIQIQPQQISVIDWQHVKEK